MMEKFARHCGVAAPMLRANIDTDAIIPSREMKRVSKHGLSGGLFAGLRYLDPDTRVLDPDFVLNQPEYQGASILLGGKNFGCGSSREHAVWALAEYGIRAVVAPGFGAIFAGNCVRNGVLPLVLEDVPLEEIAAWVTANPSEHCVDIDLVAQTVQAAGNSYHFDIDVGAKHMLVEGLDAISLTQTRWSKILAFHEQRKKQRPWLYES